MRKLHDLPIRRPPPPDRPLEPALHRRPHQRIPLQQQRSGSARKTKRACWLATRHGRASTARKEAKSGPSTPGRNRRKVPPNHTQAQRANGPGLAGWESTRRLRHSECTAHSRRLFLPRLPESNPVGTGGRRRFVRGVFGADRISVCEPASANARENHDGQTRGFTSCCLFM
jgi:hypothetical protein